MRKRLCAVQLVLGLVLLGASASAQGDTKLLRFPDVHGDQVVFVYAGDLWIAAIGSSDASSIARRLTAHPGQERAPKFSPDGQWVAFNGQYDGDEQVYVIPTAGGEPRQLTYYPAEGPLPPRWGFDNQVLGWSPDGKAVLMRSVRASWGLANGRMYSIPVAGGLPKALPMPEAGIGVASPDGTRVVYSPLFRDFRTWKRYQGGWAQELYIFDLNSHQVERVTDNPRADRDPMWVGNTIFFNSDRDGIFNLYAFDVSSRTTTQITRETVWDVRWPSADPEGRIVFELNGQLELLDTRSGERRLLPIQVPDDGLARRPYRTSAADSIEDFQLSPNGKRALFTARGDVFSVPLENGSTRNLTRSPGAHDKSAYWAPDGKSVVFLSDRDGEEEIYRVDALGRGDPEQLTDGGLAMRFSPRVSPDGKRIAFSDKDGKLYGLNLSDREITEIADDPAGNIGDYLWSRDSAYLAFSMAGKNNLRSIYIWSAKDGKLHRVTGDHFNESEPVWGHQGKYLYFLADHDFAPQIGSREWNYTLNREVGIFALALSLETPHPFPPREDSPEPGTDDEDDDEDGTQAAAQPTKIDFEGLGQRVARVPVEADNISNLEAVPGRLLYTIGGAFVYGRSSYTPTSLRAFSLEDREITVLAEDMNGYTVSGDGTRALVAMGGGFHWLETDAEEAGEEEAVSTAGLMVDRVPTAEWAQIFDEVWRRFRDYFYVENMHGYDWEALRDRYRPLLEHVGHRDDLSYLLGELIAELSVGHAYIAGGDFAAPERPPVGLLGALLELDEKAGRYRLAKIYQGHNEEPRYRSPLTEIGVHASPGDYLLAIDGEVLSPQDNPYRLLRHKADRPVTLTLNSRPSLEGSREVTIQPIDSESSLRYLDLVEGNRRKVAELSDGRLGYLHIPDMGSDGIREFIKNFYPQRDKEGLVIDVRGNGGGNVSQMILERLSRNVLAGSWARTWDMPQPYPRSTFLGALACLVDEDSASDGDIFPYMFQKSALGPLIGKRSWGGVIGITNRGTLIDGGSVNVPEFGFLSPEGEWIIEGHGVDPDIVVENDPKSVIEGRDPQLERGVAEVLRQLEETPSTWMKTLPEGPIKTPAPVAGP